MAFVSSARCIVDTWIGVRVRARIRVRARVMVRVRFGFGLWLGGIVRTTGAEHRMPHLASAASLPPLSFSSSTPAPAAACAETALTWLLLGAGVGVRVGVRVEVRVRARLRARVQG